jgi:hypothetical protein
VLWFSWDPRDGKTRMRPGERRPALTGAGLEDGLVMSYDFFAESEAPVGFERPCIFYAFLAGDARPA